MDHKERPNVSILTPIYDRKEFLPLMIDNMKLISDYPRNKLEWVILDSHSRDGVVADKLFNSQEEIDQVSEEIGIKIIYEYKNERLSIGKKRNMLVKMASHNHLINMDSDDIYFPHYILYSISCLIHNKKGCVGSPQMLFMYPHHDYKITAIQCEANRQIHEATICFTRKHWKRMGGFETSNQGEGAKMVDGCNEKFFMKTEITKCMICVCHDNNTVGKEQFFKDDLIINGLTEIDNIPQVSTIKKMLE